MSLPKPKQGHEGRNHMIICLSVAVGFVLAFGYFSGMFAWFHDMGVYMDKRKAEINAQVEAETSCNNLATFIKPYEGYWEQPYVVKKAKDRMVELKC